MIAGRGKIVDPSGLLALVPRQPFGMGAGILLVIAGRDADRRLHADFMGRLNLPAHQIKIKVRVHKVDFSGIIEPAVMAF